MQFIKNFIILEFVFLLALINLIPLELLPHTHDGTEPQVHNNFSFIPREIVQTPELVLALVKQNIIPLNIKINKPTVLLTELTPNNKSPPII